MRFLLLSLLLACAPSPAAPTCQEAVDALALATAGAIAGTRWNLLDSERVSADLARGVGHVYEPGPFATPEAAQRRAEQLWCPALERASGLSCSVALERAGVALSPD